MAERERKLRTATRLGATATAAVAAVGLAGGVGWAGQSTHDTPAQQHGPTISKEYFGQTDGAPVHQYTLTNGHGMRVRILDYGGIIQSLDTPDRTGHEHNIVLGFATLNDYLTHNS
ncbi:MAG TPA: hypothetical protein VJ914_32485, partial [Pseudonocardiaceae bacterium]|nr:hypothetical protein [Pseudonocardiaceae bacterium]